MHVRKFEADTLEEALRIVKEEFGPDAIILKTVNNKGIKGAFKKSKVEITAAISEKSYVKKSHVDKVLSPDQKQNFYSSDASYVSSMIDDFGSRKMDKNKTPISSKAGGGYGQMALNKQVKAVEKLESQEGPQEMKTGLDAFLSRPTPRPQQTTIREEEQEVVRPLKQPPQSKPTPVKTETYEEHEAPSSKKIEMLEKKIFELSNRLAEFQKPEPRGAYQLASILRSLDISTHYVNMIVQKATFDLSKIELENEEVVFEYALTEMIKEIRVDRPQFATSETNQSVVTVLLSGGNSGQTSMLLKLGAVKENSQLITYVAGNKSVDALTFAEKIFGMDVKRTTSISEIVAETRKAAELHKTIFIDYKTNQTDLVQTKNFIDGLRRGFRHVEVLISLSAIHSEMYNKKVVGMLRSIADGIVISHLDECVNFGALFNLAHAEKQLPIKFFGTGKIVPDDLEAATAERILAGMFQLEE